MTRSGFAIRCPHCLEWNRWDLDPVAVALESEEELRGILEGLRKAPQGFSHPKLLRCGQPHWACPARFEAFVCKNEADALRFVEIPEAWSVKRDFRLYRTDRRTRWDPYCGILFSTQPVVRQRDIVLDHLLDPELLSRALLGASIEVGAPVTVYAAKVIDGSQGRRTCWVPIEAYSQKREILVPPRYNAFCHLCRKTVMANLARRFTGTDRADKCAERALPAGACAGRDLLCEGEDWRACPQFLEMRDRECPCYKSDCGIIGEVERRWRAGSRLEKGLVRKCWAGFTEICFPLVVHDHLVGALMSGQFVLGEQDLCPVNELVEGFPILKSVQGRLKELREVLLGRRKPRTEEEEYARTFRVSRRSLSARIPLFRRHVDLLQSVATSRYRNIRARSEQVFKQELLGRIEYITKERDFFRGPVLEILERMREFWAFKAVYLLVCPHETEDLYLVGLSAPNRSIQFGHPGRRIAPAGPIRRQKHPLPFLYDTSRRAVPHSPWVQRILDCFRDAVKDPELGLSKGRCYFNVLAPFTGHVYAFVFAVRDESAVSPLRPRDRGGVSELCQEVILGTCTDVVQRFGEVWFRQVRERAWREFSRLASHRIGNQVNAVGTLLDVLSTELVADPNWARDWGDRLSVMKGCIRETKRMLVEQARLTAEVKPDLRSVDLPELVRRSGTGSLPDPSAMSIQAPGDLPNVLLDPGLMEGVFRELIVNAARAAGEGVRIAVRIAVEQGFPPGDDAIPGGRTIRIVFSDNGPGIPPERMDRIFEPFVTFTPERTGLGLTTVRRIVEAHGGTVRAAPSTSGAVFVIEIPLKET